MLGFRARTRRVGAGEPGAGNHTLDSRHQNRLESFREARTKRIPELIEEKEKLKNQLRNRPSLDEKLEIKDRLQSIRAELREVKQARDQYLLNYGPQVFDYFERKKQIDAGVGETTVLEDFFRVGKDSRNTTGNASNMGKTRDPLAPPDAEDCCTNIDVDRCPDCGEGELIAVECEGMLVCSVCARSRPYLVENDKPSYKEPPKEVCFYAYKRINHFREILAQFQAKETTQIPKQVLEAIKQQIKKERISLAQLSNRKAKEILKKLGYNKYYEHIPFIKDKLGIKPPIMSSELEETLCRLFMEIQAPYAKYCPDDRVNFLNYYYTVYKLCELLEQTQFLPFFPMLKDREKRIEQDEIWKKICHELDWEFIPTV